MAVYLDPSANARLEFGDIAAIAGLTQITVALTFRLRAAAATNARFCGQWSSADGAFLMTGQDTDEIGFVVKNSSSILIGKKTTQANLAPGRIYRVTANWTATGTDIRLINIWINGHEEPTTDWFANFSTVGIRNVTQVVYTGYEAASPAAGQDMEVAEFAIWDHNIPDPIKKKYGEGWSPNIYRKGGILYCKAATIGAGLRDEWAVRTITNTAGVQAPHPYMQPGVWPALQNFMGAFVPGSGQTVSISKAGLGFTGQTETTNARETLAATKATLGFTGRTLAVNAKTFVAVAKAAWSWTGQAVSAVNTGNVVQIAAAAWGFAGRAITVFGADTNVFTWLPQLRLRERVRSLLTVPKD
ncbi:MAG: hypothetical protein WCF16_08905 [Alphaproteobacteria bacterium]